LTPLSFFFVKNNCFILLPPSFFEERLDDIGEETASNPAAYANKPPTYLDTAFCTAVEAEMSIHLKDKGRLRCKNPTPGTRRVFTLNVVQYPRTERRKCDLRKRAWDQVFLFENVIMVSVRDTYRGFVSGREKKASPVRSPGAGRAWGVCENTSYNETQATTS